MIESNFFEVVLHRPERPKELLGLCAGFENGNWRIDGLVDFAMEFLPSFALGYSAFTEIRSNNAVAKLRQAAKLVYETDNSLRRGEFGELLLHSILVDLYKTKPAISKIYYKSASNDTVKGFDCVHVSFNPISESLDIWLGEVKFYTIFEQALKDVVNELKRHLSAKFFRNEFLVIERYIDSDWEHASKLKELLSAKKSLDKVYGSIRIPILMLYQSKIIEKHNQFSQEYINELRLDFESKFNKFELDNLPSMITLHVILLPFKNKNELQQQFDQKLKIWQQL